MCMCDKVFSFFDLSVCQIYLYIISVYQNSALKLNTRTEYNNAKWC